MEQLVDTKTLAGMLDVKESTIRKWVFERRIPCVRVGGRLVRFRPSEIERWISERDRDRWQ